MTSLHRFCTNIASPKLNVNVVKSTTFFQGPPALGDREVGEIDHRTEMIWTLTGTLT